jgi:long-chain acyl-CoA synthetase
VAEAAGTQRARTTDCAVMSLVLTQIAAHAGSTPTAAALKGHDRTLTCTDLAHEIEHASRLLLRQRVGVLAIAADNSTDWVVVDLAAQKAGVTLVPLPLFFSPDQIRHVIADSGADAIAVDDGASRLIPGLGPAHSTRVGKLALHRLPDSGTSTLPPDTAKISYTSGTSGRPKGVCLSQAAMDTVARSVCIATDAAAIKSHLSVLPLATLLENIAGVYAPLLRGIAVELPSLRDVGLREATRLDVDQFVATLKQYRPDSIILLPQMLAALVAAAEHGVALPDSLRFVAVGGALVPASLLERADRLGLPVYEGYGLTECASVVALNTPGARRIGSVGRPLAHIELRIGSGSEIIVRGAAMQGYLRDGGGRVPADVATGDIGHLDADGFLYITGRRKHMFITSFGRNVQPEWIETELVATDSIAQAALFGEARPWNVAVIVARPGAAHRVIETDIEATNRRLPAYARIHQWIPADAPFTTGNGLATSNGRCRREAIFDRYRARIDACYDNALSTCA